MKISTILLEKLFFFLEYMYIIKPTIRVNKYLGYLSMLQRLQHVESVTESNDFDLKKNRNFIYLIISKNR